MHLGFLDKNKIVRCIDADANAAGTLNGAAVDTLGFGEFTAVISAGTAGGTVDVKLQESDASGSGFTDITGAAFSTINSTTDDAVYGSSVSLRFTKRYLRVVAVTATAACDFSVVGVLSGAIQEPVSQDNTIDFQLVND